MPPCGITYEDPQPRLFSFNSPFGACPTCHGFGNVIELDMDLVVPDPTLTIQEGRDRAVEQAALPGVPGGPETGGAAQGVRLDTPWEELSTDASAASCLEGDGDGSRGRAGVLRLARTEEVQGARPGLPEPVPRATRRAPTAAGRGCGARRATCGWAGGRSTRCRR